MNIPASMMAQAKTFCSMQPCVRFAEGDIVIERNGGVETHPVCPRHHEYIMQYYGQQDFDPSIVGKEVVFTDEVDDDEMISQIVEHGNVHEIVTPR